MVLLTASQMRELDRAAIEDYSVPSLYLMENAALSSVNAFLDIVPPKCTVAVFCGTGNNGGDGFAAARILHELKFSVRCFVLGDMTRMTTDATEMCRKLKDSGVVPEPFSKDAHDYTLHAGGIIDAIFGIGLARDVEGEYKEAIELINRAPCSVLSCDIPSGIHADTGKIMGCAVKADVTVTFTFSKPGLNENEGKKHAGNVIVAPIGIPNELTDEFLDKN